MRSSSLLNMSIGFAVWLNWRDMDDREGEASVPACQPTSGLGGAAMTQRGLDVSLDDDMEAVFLAYRNALVAHCYRFLGSLQDSEEAAQETFVRARRIARASEAIPRLGRGCSALLPGSVSTSCAAANAVSCPPLAGTLPARRSHSSRRPRTSRGLGRSTHGLSVGLLR